MFAAVVNAIAYNHVINAVLKHRNKLKNNIQKNTTEQQTNTKNYMVFSKGDKNGKKINKNYERFIKDRMDNYSNSVFYSLLVRIG